MPSPSDPRNRHRHQEHATQEPTAEPAAPAAHIVPGMPARDLPIGPGHHLQEEWDQGYPGARISIPAAELAADRELIG